MSNVSLINGHIDEPKGKSVKPNIHGYREGRYINTISYTCPVCNNHISRDAFCKHCGQALDWSDTE